MQPSYRRAHMGEAAVDLRKPRTVWWRRLVRWLKDWLRVDFSSLRPKEKWAYGIWGSEQVAKDVAAVAIERVHEDPGIP